MKDSKALFAFSEFLLNYLAFCNITNNANGMPCVENTEAGQGKFNGYLMPISVACLQIKSAVNSIPFSCLLKFTKGRGMLLVISRWC